MLRGSKQSLSRGIRESKMDISRVGECRLCRLGAVLGRKIRADSKTQDPGEFCQTRLQDTDTLSQTKQSCSYALVHIFASFWEEDKCVHETKCRCGHGESNSVKGQNLHCLRVMRGCVFQCVGNVEHAHWIYWVLFIVYFIFLFISHFFPEMIKQTNKKKILGRCWCIFLKTAFWENQPSPKWSFNPNSLWAL